MLGDQIRAVLRVTAHAKRRLWPRMIELRVDEARRGGAAERDRLSGGEVIRLELQALPVDEVLPVRGDPEDLLRGERPLLDEGALARHRVDAVDVRLRRLVIRDVRAGIAANGPDA